jgi:hypothetical protein
MTNLIEDYFGRIRLDDVGQCQSMEHGIACVGRGHSNIRRLKL